VASCPRTLQYLRAAGCRALTDALNLAHLSELAALVASETKLGDGMLRRLPPSLQRLELADTKLTPAAALPPLPRLTCIVVSRTAVGVPFLVSLPPGVAHLDVSECDLICAEDADAAWQSLVDSGALDRLVECPDLLPHVAAALESRGVSLWPSSSHTCMPQSPAPLRPEAARPMSCAEPDPFAPGFVNRDDEARYPERGNRDSEGEEEDDSDDSSDFYGSDGEVFGDERSYD